MLSKVLLVQEELTETLLKIKQLVANTPYNAPRLPDNFIGDEPLHPMNLKPVLSYNELMGLIQEATSSTELHKAWKEVERNKELASWHLKKLNEEKELQRTKIDF